MLDCLAQGKLTAAPQQRTTKAGKTFATARMKVAMPDGETIFASLAAFDEQPVKALLALGVGDSIAAAGSMKLGVWSDKDGNHRPNIDITAQQVMTVYQVRHKRNATQGEGQYQGRPRDDAARAFAPPDRPQHHDPMDGEMPF